MWDRLKRSAQAPLKVTGLLGRIILLLEEQNGLLRELHQAQTGSHARTPRRGTTSPTPTRIRTGSDVWQRTPLTEDEQRTRARVESESAASAPVDTPNAEGILSASAPAPEGQSSMPTGADISESTADGRPRK